MFHGVQGVRDVRTYILKSTLILQFYMVGFIMKSVITVLSCVAPFFAFPAITLAVDPIVPQPQIIWIERDDGDATFYNDIIQFATTSQYLKGTKLLLRLADPHSTNPAIANNFQLDADSGLIKCIRGLSANGYTGTISLIPDFTHAQDWNWNPDKDVITSSAVKWMKPYYWAKIANQILADASCPLLISEVNLETASSGIAADETTLNPVRAYQATLWPAGPTQVGYVKSAMTFGFTAMTGALAWENPGTPTDSWTAPILDFAYLELYNMYKESHGTTYLDAYAVGANVGASPQPALPNTIYSLAASMPNPVASVMGDPTDATPASTFGFLFGSHAPANAFAGIDLSRICLLFSIENFTKRRAGSLIDAFGTWDAPIAGPGAGVDEFIQFEKQFLTTFMPFWGSPSAPPQMGIFEFNALPPTWIQSTPLSTPSFDSMNFVMWDYRDAAPGQVSLSTYHEWLLTYCHEHPPQRLVLYVTDPTLPNFGFYTANAQPVTIPGSMNFVGFLKQLRLQSPGVEVEVLIDRSSWQNVATPPSSGLLPLPDVWNALPDAFTWLTTLMGNSALAGGNPIKGLTIDPEMGCENPNTGCVLTDNTCPCASIAYQRIVDWLDHQKRVNGLSALRIGLALEVDSQNFAKLNVSDFPMSHDLIQVLSNASPELASFTQGSEPPSWRTAAGDNSSLLQSVYLEAYVGCGQVPGGGQILTQGSYWRWMTSGGCNDSATPVPTSPAVAALAFQRSLQRIPSVPGVGSIVATPQGGNNVLITGTGTNFNYSDQICPYEDYTRIAISKPDGTFIPDITQQVSWVLPLSSGDALPSALSAGATGQQVTAGTSPLPFYYTEIPFDWGAPSMTPTMVNRIFFAFSAEKETVLPFFGYWTLDNFVSFVDQFRNATQGTDPTKFIYKDSSGHGIAMPMNNFAIYDLKQACNSWGIAAYPTDPSNDPPCIGDLDQSGSVDSADIAGILLQWGNMGGSADFDHSGEVDGGDFGLALINSGECN